ncbi:hypothetical protein KKD70_02800, partial [Patescibacteria group bacterium]|nr:hypothetical protein [Patescibacteria group bacterium]
STTLTDGPVKLYEVTIAADATGPVAIKQLQFDTTASGVTLSNAQLYRDDVLISDSTDIDLIDLAAAGDAEAGAFTTGVVAKWSDATATGEDLIPAGSSVTYTLKATVTGATSGDSLTTTLHYDSVAKAGVITAGTSYSVAGTASGFVWSDKSVSPHVSTVAGPSSTDYLNGYLVSGLAAIDSHVLSK